MLQWFYRYITGKLKMNAIKDSLSHNGPAKQSNLLKYCILNLLTLSEKDWWKISDCMQPIVVVIKSQQIRVIKYMI